MDKERVVSIHMKTLQSELDGISNTMEFFAEGKYFEKDKSKYITYKESEISGMEGTSTTIKINEDIITIIRFGNITSKLVFQRGIKSNNKYQTPYGIFDIIVDTKELDISINEDKKSSISIKYTLCINKTDTLYNELLLSFM